MVVDGFDDPLGGAFMVMERVDGVAPFDDLGFGRAMVGMPTTFRRLPRLLATVTFELHRLDPQPIVDALDLAGIDVGDLGVAAHLDEIDRVARTTSLRGRRRARWLEHRRPVMAPVVVCHGDIHPFNLLVADDGSFNVLDWTNGNICRREYDVGFTAGLLVLCADGQLPRIAQRPMVAIADSLSRRFVES